MHKTALIMLLLAGSLLGGCQTYQERKTANALDSTLISYAATLRWGQLDQLYQFLDPVSEQPVPESRLLENIRVTGYRVIKPAVISPEDHAEQSALIHFVFVDRQIEKSLVDNQVWEYNQELKRWTRINPIPAFE